MNIPIYVNEIEFIFKYLPTKITPVPDSFTGEFYQTLGKEIIHVTQFLQEIEEGTLFNEFYKARITLTPKPDKYITRNKTIAQYSSLT